MLNEATQSIEAEREPPTLIAHTLNLAIGILTAAHDVVDAGYRATYPQAFPYKPDC